MGILRAPDEELMDVAGLEGFVFMRLMRMGCRLSLFGSVIAIPVTWIFLSEGDGSLRFRLDGQRRRGQRRSSGPRSARSGS